jgi:microcystin degradation protein MlrC
MVYKFRQVNGYNSVTYHHLEETSMKRVFMGGISTETNTFSPMPTGMSDFHIIRAAQEADPNNDLEGGRAFINMIRQRTAERGWEFVFGLDASAEPAGTTVRSVYESLRDEMLEDLKAAIPVDVVLLPLHGAMVADGYDDCEGDMIARVREIVGLDAKIGVELDLHCHLTQKMLDHADVIVIFKEYPHTDILTRAEEMFKLTADTAEGKIKPTMAMYDCRMINMYRTPLEPMRTFVDEMSAMEGKDGVLSVSLAHCFPWGDVPDCGARTLVVTDNDPVKAAQLAEELGKKFFALRHEVSLNPLLLDEALDKAQAIKSSPVVIADQADNAGGGAPSDSTFVLREMLNRGIENAALALMWDPIAVQVAMSAGLGAEINIRLGGKMGPMSGDPLDLRVKVTGVIKDMYQEFPQDGLPPLPAPLGDSVCLTCNGIDIIVNSRRAQVLSPMVFTNFGIDVSKKHILVVKSTQHFYAGFSPIASEVIYMAAPGAIAPLFKEIPFQRVDLNKYPWVDDPFAAG